jgi:hypothetical protein
MQPKESLPRDMHAIEIRVLRKLRASEARALRNVSVVKYGVATKFDWFGLAAPECGIIFSPGFLEPLRATLTVQLITPTMIDKITTALIALAFATLMTWFILSPFLAPNLYFRASGGAETPHASQKQMIRQHSV